MQRIVHFNTLGKLPFTGEKKLFNVLGFFFVWLGIESKFEFSLLSSSLRFDIFRFIHDFNRFHQLFNSLRSIFHAVINIRNSLNRIFFSLYWTELCCCQLAKCSNDFNLHLHINWLFLLKPLLWSISIINLRTLHFYLFRAIVITITKQKGLLTEIK